MLGNSGNLAKELEAARQRLMLPKSSRRRLPIGRRTPSATRRLTELGQSTVPQALAEFERLKLVNELEIQIEDDTRDAARAALLQERSALQKKTEQLARRISVDFGKAAADLVKFATEAIANTIAVENLNKRLANLDCDPLRNDSSHCGVSKRTTI